MLTMAEKRVVWNMRSVGDRPQVRNAGMEDQIYAYSSCQPVVVASMAYWAGSYSGLVLRFDAQEGYIGPL